MKGLGEQLRHLDGSRDVENVALVHVVLGEGMDVVKDGRGRALVAAAVGQLDHVAQFRKLLDGEHHLCGHNVSLLHLEGNPSTTLYHLMYDNKYIFQMIV